jgi:hypothetical protein
MASWACPSNIRNGVTVGSIDFPSIDGDEKTRSGSGAAELYATSIAQVKGREIACRHPDGKFIPHFATRFLDFP